MEIIDAAILALILSGKSDCIGVCFDPVAWGYFKNHPLVIERAKGDVSFQSCPGMFHTNAEFMAGYAFDDANKAGASPNMQFMLPAGSVTIFTRSEMPNRADASWLKTFIVNPSKTKFSLALTKDERTVICKFDWSQVVVNTNTAGATRLNITRTAGNAP